ncbi:MAG TPA: DUF4270 family protein [Chryseosolibacter sp.]|nr:DUF4270 family protein [Chryseosolibacter sp.]
MNLWAKSLGQFAFIAIALFFFSCEDDTIQGYKTNPKFKVSYQEFILPSSVMLLDSIRTSNYHFASESNRLLVGQYTDPVFGTVKATFYSQIYPVSPIGVPKSSVYDSATLDLGFDLYTYGGYSVNSQTIGIYKLTENLYDVNKVDYTNESTVETAATHLASKMFTVIAQQFDQYVEQDKDTTIILSIKLPVAFGGEIFNVIKDYSTGGSDSAVFASRDEFLARFKGLAFKSEIGDKIIGFNPAASATRLKLHYHTSSDTTDYLLSFANQISFTQIDFDRSGSPLATVANKYTEYLNEDPFRYIQSGSGMVTKVDLKPFLDFADANEDILLNGVEVVVEDVAPSVLAPPASLALRAIDPLSNRLKKYSANSPQDIEDLVAYGGYFLPDFPSNITSSAIQIERDSAFYVVNDAGGSSVMSYDESEGLYSGFVTSFFQQLTYNDGRSRPRYFVLYPTSPSGAKSVNRAVFPADKIKLRIYYTTPLQ